MVIPGPQDVTKKDADKHIMLLVMLGMRDPIISENPAAFFDSESLRVESRLIKLTGGIGEIPEGMTKEKAIEWLEGVIEYQKAYRACYD